MESTASRARVHDPSSTRILVVADWKLDPHAVVAACSRHLESHDASFALLVPAWLHGLDWAGDPTASLPCAQRQLERVHELCVAAGLPVSTADVGDPNAVTAIGDVLLSQPVDEILVCVRARHVVGHRFDLAHRAERATGIPTRRVAVPAARGRSRIPTWTRLRRGHRAVVAG